MFGVLKSRKMRWALHVACVGQKKNAYRILVVKAERAHLKDLGLDGSVILK